MNSTQHCKLSRRRWGGHEDDYRAIHDFIDSTKSLCADARHRILHTHWALNNVVVPIFGHTLTNSDGTEVNVRDLCERDHLLADFTNRFIPTLRDFVDAIDETAVPDLKARVEAFHAEHVRDERIGELLLSPLAETGRLKSLLLTHNSWFLNRIVPRVFGGATILDDFDLAPADFFGAMAFRRWMDNGLIDAPSAQPLTQHRVAG